MLEDPSVTDESYFVMIRELDEGDNPHDESAWRKPNPCLRYPSRYSEILRKQIQDEHNAAYTSNDPSKIRKFLTRRMCLWQVGSVNHYLDERCMAKAKAAMVPPEEFAALTDGLHNHCGFDLGKRIDLSGAAAVFDLPDGRIGAGCEETGDERHAAHSPAHLPQPSHASSQRPRDRRSECRFYPQQVVVGQKHGLRAIVSLPKQIAGLLHPLFEYEIHRLRA